MNPEEELKNAGMVIWAMGGKGTADKAHAYLSEQDYGKGNCLCGRGIKPHLRMEHWDLSNELIEEHTCPQCRERLKLLAFISKDRK